VACGSWPHLLGKEHDPPHPPHFLTGRFWPIIVAEDKRKIHNILDTGTLSLSAPGTSGTRAWLAIFCLPAALSVLTCVYSTIRDQSLNRCFDLHPLVETFLASCFMAKPDPTNHSRRKQNKRKTQEPMQPCMNSPDCPRVRKHAAQTAFRRRASTRSNAKIESLTYAMLSWFG